MAALYNGCDHVSILVKVTPDVVNISMKDVFQYNVGISNTSPVTGRATDE